MLVGLKPGGKLKSTSASGCSYTGKGAPPKARSSPGEVLNFVQNTPGAIGYIDEADLKPGLNVLLKK